MISPAGEPPASSLQVFFPQRSEVSVVILPKRSLITRPWAAPYLSSCCLSTSLIVFDSVFQSNFLIPALGLARDMQKSLFIVLFGS